MEDYLGLTRRWEFDHRLVQFFKAYFNSIKIPASPFPRDAVLERLIQASYSFVLRKLASKNSNEEILIAGLVLNEKENSLEIPLSILILQYCKFLRRFFFYFMMLPICSLSKKKEFRLASVLMDIPIEKIKKSRSYDLFKEYCELGPIDILGKKYDLYIKSDKSQRDGRFIQSKFPLLDLASTSFTLVDLPRWIIENIKTFINYTYLCLRERAFCFLNTDFSYFGLVRYLNEKGRLDKLIITNSSLYNQQLWMSDLKDKKFSSEMIWYSANNKNPIYKRFESENSDSPCYNLLNIDRNWVWSESEKLWVKSFSPDRNVNVVGPIIFEPLLSQEPVEKRELYVTIFDIIPPSEEAIVKMLGVPRIYQNFDVLKSFVNDILEACKEVERELNIPLNILLKHKRDERTDRDTRYFDFIDSLEKNNLLKKVDASNSVFLLIKKSSLVLSTPFTSTNLIAAYYNIPSVYYDPEDCLVPHSLPDGVDFIATKTILKNKIMEIFREH